MESWNLHPTYRESNPSILPVSAPSTQRSVDMVVLRCTEHVYLHALDSFVHINSAFNCVRILGGGSRLLLTLSPVK